MISRHASPSILVDFNLNVQYTFGAITPFWVLKPGEVSLSVSHVLVSPIAAIASALVAKAKKVNEVIVSDIINFRHNDVLQKIKVEVSPIEEKGKFHFLISLQSIPDVLTALPQSLNESKVERETSLYIESLESELKMTKQSLQATIEELETTNEELQATNEELMASNEEMQSSNEELQSVNEELNTVNAEYQKKTAILNNTLADLEGMNKAVGIALLFLDQRLCLTRYSPDAVSLFRVRETDIGRPITEIVNDVVGRSLVDDMQMTLATERTLEAEIRTSTNSDYLMRILPYRLPSSNELGLVASFIDITVLKTYEQTQQLLNALPENIAVLMADGTIGMINQSWERFAKANGDPELTTTGLGSNYLTTCGACSDEDEDAGQAYKGVKSVLQGTQKEFSMCYPCHSPTESRWFVMQVVPFNVGDFAAVVSHFNITAWQEKSS